MKAMKQECFITSLPRQAAARDLNRVILSKSSEIEAITKKVLGN